MISDDDIKAAAREWINREYWGPHEPSMEVTDPIRERDFCEGARWVLRELKEHLTEQVIGMARTWRSPIDEETVLAVMLEDLKGVIEAIGRKRPEYTGHWVIGEVEVPDQIVFEGEEK